MTLFATHPACTTRVATERLGLMQRLIQFHALAQQRRDLAALEPHQLRDVGISSTEARNEAARPVWDVPQTWVK